MLVSVKYIRFFAARFVQRTYNRAAPQLEYYHVAVNFVRVQGLLGITAACFVLRR